MTDIRNQIVQSTSFLKEAMVMINNLPRSLTLFVLDRQNHLVGTLTDGDIRRGLLSGYPFEGKVSDFMNTDFQYIEEVADVRRIKEWKNEGVRLLPKVNQKMEIVEVYDLYRLKSILPLEAVIMAGGKGDRLRPLTDKLPKPMLKLGNKPIMEYTIERLVLYGIEKIYISVNYLKEKIIEYFGDGSEFGVSIEYIEERIPLGTCGALSLIDNVENDILITNSDLFTNIDYENLFLAFNDAKADMAVASVPYTVNIPYAILTEEDNQVTSLREKPSNTHYANAGVYILRKENMGLIPSNMYFNSTDLLTKMIGIGKVIIHNPVVGYWIDIGSPEDYNKALEIVKHL